MKKTSIILLFVIALATVANAIVIKQVLYDPINTESGGEAVEILNEQNEEINLTNWYIKTEKSNKDFIFLQTILFPHQSFLVADEGWHEKKDNPDWKNADAEESITLYNKDSGVALFDAENNLIDAVGWGSVNNSQLYKGVSAANIKEGNALARIRYTGNNREDFMESPPDFFANELAIRISIEQENNVENIEIEDEDLLKDRIQVSNSRSKNISLKVKFFANYTDDAFINFNNKLVLCKRKALFCETEIEIAKELEGRDYFLEIKAGSQILQKTVEILGRKGFKLDKSEIKASAKKGEELVQNITIKNVGNLNQEIKLKIIMENEQIGNIFYSEDKKNFKEIKEDSFIFLSFSEQKTIFLKIKIPEKTKEGTYRGRVVFEVV